MGLTAGQFDFSLVQGSTWTDQIAYSDGNTPPTYANLTGWSAICRLRSLVDESITLELSTTNGGLVLVNVTGVAYPSAV